MTNLTFSIDESPESNSKYIKRLNNVINNPILFL
ncbi:hypothetical protein MCCPILRI181_00104 [Mycoplasma capricolum subsp. capripneumoniae]|nr:hypothetical protein Mccp14020TZ_01060 [Mycoplasma capricolum subsp. capripneumoniae]CEA10472.1 hypothetical protein MCCPILRI181_00104 [Mycoplasma capricolum subsp. capripneumoniae]